MIHLGLILAGAGIALVLGSLGLRWFLMRRRAKKMLDRASMGQVGTLRAVSLDVLMREIEGKLALPGWLNVCGFLTFLLLAAAVCLLLAGSFAWAWAISNAWLRWLVVYLLVGVPIELLHVIGNGWEGLASLLSNMVFWPLVALLKLTGPIPDTRGEEEAGESEEELDEEEEEEEEYRPPPRRDRRRRRKRRR